MDYRTPDMNKWPTKLVLRMSKTIRSEKSLSREAIVKNEQRRAVLRKKRLDKLGYIPRGADPNDVQADVDELGERRYSGTTLAASILTNRDHTDLLHGLAEHSSSESLAELARGELRDPYFDSKDPEVIARKHAQAQLHRLQFAALPSHVWKRIACMLDPADAASLTITTRLLYDKLGPDFLFALNAPENQHAKIAFLNRLERHLPGHLICFPCMRFHRRSNAGLESLKADFVANPLYVCPSVRDTVLPRMRITHGRELPYSFVQLALRRQRHTTKHGIKHDSLSRQWKCKDSPWSHKTRYLIVDGHLLMRITSQCLAPPAADQTETSQRHLLYDREEYTPFFSVCAHWKDGNLMQTCKCALSHIPSPPKSYIQQLKKAPKIDRAAASPVFLFQGCDDCRPARRCPECPSEYLVETPMIEDHNDSVVRFKHALRVTRWADLGDGSSPYTSPEWAAIKGIHATTLGKTYDSFSHVGRRSVAGIFESKVSGSVPGQRMVSMNPKNEKLGEEGHGWY